MRQGDRQLGIPQIIFVGTKASIEAITGLDEGAIAYASDQAADSAFGTYDGSVWTWGQGQLPIVASEATILAITPTAGLVAKATDTNFLYFADGTYWRRSSLKLNIQTITPDMGSIQHNSRDGYYDDMITDKVLNHVVIGDNVRNEEGAPRTINGYFQIYLNGRWNDIVLNFRFVENPAESYELEHQPIGFSGWYDVYSGNSNTLGLNGLPLTQNYSTSMGAYSVPLIIDGGDLTGEPA